MKKSWKTAAICALCTVAVLSTAFSAVTLIRLKRLENNVTMVQNSVTNIDSDINSTLNSAISTITQSAQQTASIISDYQVKWGECSQKDQSMKVTIRIMPKGYHDDTKVRVRYSGYSAKGQGYDMVFDTEGFDEQTAQAQRVESGVYEAELTIPLVDYISLNAEVENDGVVRQEKLEDQYSAWGLRLLHPQMTVGFEEYTSESKGKTIEYQAYATVNLMTSYDAGGVTNDPQMVGGSVSLYLNDKELLKQDLKETADEEQQQPQKTVTVDEDGQREVMTVWGNEQSDVTTRWSGKISDLKDGDIVTFVMRIQDENGFTYEQEVSRTVFEVKDGWITEREIGPENSEILIRA